MHDPTVGEFTIRAATSADRSAVEEMLRDSSAPQGEASHALSMLEGPAPCALIAVAGEAGKVVGLETMRIGMGTDGSLVATVDRLVVLDSWRGRGVGAALLESLRREAVARRCRELRVATRSRPGP